NHPKGREVCHRARNDCADGKLLRNCLPRIAQCLLVPEADAMLFIIDLQNDSLNPFANLQQITWLADSLVPGQLGKVNQTVDSGQQLDECSKIGEARNRATYPVSNFKGACGHTPRIFLQLL